MKYLFTILSIFMVTSLIAEKPKYLDVTRRDRGENGYDIVRQKWTDEEASTGLLTCLNPGYSECKWYGGVGKYPIDVDYYAGLLLQEHANGENSGAGTLVVDGSTVSYQIIESLGGADGTVRFVFPDEE